VKQSVHAAKIDECTEVGDVLHDALADLILLEVLHELVALARSLLLQDHAARDDDIASALVELDDLELERLAEKLIDVGNTTKRDLRAGKECIDSHEIDDDATLDLLDEGAVDRLIVLVGNANALPHAHEVGFLLGKND
jgi:hypothetical protein